MFSNVWSLTHSRKLYDRILWWADQQGEEPAEGIPGASEVCQGPLVILEGTSLHTMT